MKKEGKKKKEERNQLWPLQNTRHQIANFCLWLVDYSASILANHRPRSWKSLEILDCFRLNQCYK